MTGAVRVGWRGGLTLAIASAGGLVAFLWPLVVAPESAVAHSADAPLVFALLLPVSLAVVLTQLSEGGLDAKAVATLGVLTAVGAALRPLGAGAGGIELVFFVLIVGGRAFGPGFGFVLGVVTLLASALLTGGVGPWLPFQMLGAGWVGLGAGLLPPARDRGEIVLLALYGAFAALLYGLLLNLSFWPFATGPGTELSFVPGAPLADNLGRFLAFSVTTSLGWDVGRALTNVALIVLLGRPILNVLARATRRASFGAQPRFEPG